MLKVGFAWVVGEERKRRIRMHTQSNQLFESCQHFRHCRAAVETNHLHTQDVQTSQPTLTSNATSAHLVRVVGQMNGNAHWLRVLVGVAQDD